MNNNSQELLLALSDNQKQAFINYANGDEEKAAQRLKMFVEMISGPRKDWFLPITESNTLDYIRRNCFYVPLGFLEDDSRFVLYCSFADLDISEMRVETIIKLGNMYAFWMMEDPRITSAGAVFIFDMHSFSWKLIKKLINIGKLMDLIQIFQDVLPIHMTNMISFNETRHISILFSVSQPFLQADFNSRILRSTGSLSSFYTKFPRLKELVPKELGGLNYQSLLEMRNQGFDSVQKFWQDNQSLIQSIRNL